MLAVSNALSSFHYNKLSVMSVHCDEYGVAVRGTVVKTVKQTDPQISTGDQSSRSLRRVVFGTSRTSGDVLLESAKWAEADVGSMSLT
jgi:hypothetical protein